MAQTDRTDNMGGGEPASWHPRLKHPKAKKGRHRRSAKAAKGRAKHTRQHKAKGSGPWHEAAGAGSAGRSQAGAGGPAGSAGQAAHSATAHTAGSAQAAWILRGDGTGGSGLEHLPGMTGVLLDLVGEGVIGLGHALTAWQREQERVANRAWRRPGGLQRMGGL